jgi:hypothetical protein
VNPQWHDEFVALCALFPSGELSEEEWALLQVHLAYCDSCLVVFRRYEHLANKVMPAVAAIAYSDSEFEPETSSFSLDEAEQRLMSQLSSPPAELESEHRRKIRWQIPTGMLAACALGVAVFIGLHFVRSKQFLTDFWHSYWPILPGICITVLGAEALGITFIPAKVLEERKWIKRTAIAVCFTLAFGEIWMVKLDRKATDEQHKHDMQDIFARFVKLDQDVLALHSNAPLTAATRSLPSDNLKRQAIDLSNEVLSFLLSRETPPGYGQGGYGEGPFGGKPADTKDYDAQTMRSYFDAFQIRVDRMHDELKKHGLTDPEFDTEYAHTVNTYSIRTVAERIAALAKKLPG